MRGFFIRLIGNKKREEFTKENIKRIFIGGGKIGDVMVKTPMIKALGQLGGNVKIDIVLEKNAKSLMEYNPYIDEIQEANPKAKVKIKRLIDGLKFALKNRKKYDLFFDFTKAPNFMHILTLRILAPRYLVGCYRTEKYGMKRDELTIFDKYVEINPEDHAADVNLNFIRCLGIESKDTAYELFLGEELEEKYKDYFDKDFINIVFNFRGGTEKRTFNDDEIEYFLENIPKLNEKIKVHVMTIPNDYERAKKIIDRVNSNRISLLPKTASILEAGAILKYADILISVDTGIVHVGSAFNIPMVVVYPNSESSYKFFAPKSEIYKTVLGNVDGYTIAGFNREEVLAATDEILKNNMEK